jgi:hypothetical protein
VTVSASYAADARYERDVRAAARRRDTRRMSIDE